MGIAKTHFALTVYSGYSPDMKVFIHTLCQQLDADLEVSVRDRDDQPIIKLNGPTNLGKNRIFSLYGEYDEDILQGIRDTEPYYQLYIPFYGEEDCLKLTFFSNGLLEIWPINFEYSWYDLISTVRFEQGSEYRAEKVENCQQLRSRYIPLLQQLGIASLYILTDAYYHLIEAVVYESNRPQDITDIARIGAERDELQAFSLTEILASSTLSDLPKGFLELSELRIALIDYFDQ